MTLLCDIAKEWTEFNNPERITMVPIIFKAKVNPIIIQFLVNEKTCIEINKVSQGIKEIFSTGSQNHQPPQPNSW